MKFNTRYHLFVYSIALTVLFSVKVSAESIVQNSNKRTDKAKVQSASKNTNQGGGPEGKEDKPKYYMYDRATDAYLYEIIKTSYKLLREGKSDEAIELLVKEQARLDKKGRKVNLPGKYFEGSNGQIFKLKSGTKREGELLSEDKVPQIPSPLLVTLGTIRLKNGQSPLEMIDYYKEIAENYKGNINSIYSASQVVCLMGFENKNTWDFVDKTFDRSEKDKLIQCFMQSSLNESKLKITTENLKKALKQLSPDTVPNIIIKYYSKTNENNKIYFENVFWDSCPQWKEFNIQNRLSKAIKFRDEKNYEVAHQLYGEILERYKGEEVVHSQVEAIFFESQVEEVLLAHKDDEQLETIMKKYQVLFERSMEQGSKPNLIKAVCLIYLEHNKEAAELIQNKSFQSTDFLSCRLMKLISSDQRALFDEFSWSYCLGWKRYNYKTQFQYALEEYRKGQYPEALKYYDRLNGRYLDDLTLEVAIANAKCLLRVEKIDKAIALLKKNRIADKADMEILPDVVSLVRGGKVKLLFDFFSQYEELLGENKNLSPTMMFYKNYSLLLNGEYQESQVVLRKMKELYPKNLNTIKASYLNPQKERLKMAFDYTRADQFTHLVSKAGKCFDNGELEMALGIYLRIFAEYEDREEESSKACYLLGYYYLLSGEFELSNDILVFLKQQYKTSAYANEADVLIKRIEDFTS